MKVVKITAIWCSGCLIMNKVWNKVLENHDIETISLDLDMDEEEANKYNPGNILPVFIFFNNDKEVKRVVGEHDVSYMLDMIGEVIDEENR